MNNFKEFANILQTYLKEYTGLPISVRCRLDYDDEFVQSVDIKLKTDIFDSKLNIYLANMESIILRILSDNKKGELDWDIFYKLKLKLSTALAFGPIKNVSEEINRLNFLNSLVGVGNKTYESENANLGIIVIPKSKVGKIIENYHFETIYLDSPISIKELFENEKPWLRIVNGETLNLLVDKSDFMVYGFAINRVGNNLAESIVQDFEKYETYRWINTFKHNYVKKSEEMLKKNQQQNDQFEQNRTYKIFTRMKEAFEEVKVSEEPKHPQFEYLKMENLELTIYNSQSYTVHFSKGEWKLKHHYLLQSILIENTLESLLTTFLVNDVENNSENLKHAITATNTIVNTIKTLSSSNASSIIIIIPRTALGFPSGFKVNYELKEEEVKKLLELAPLKNKNTGNLYLKIIKNGENYLNAKEVNARFLNNLCLVDGALVFDSLFNILSFGEIIDTSNEKNIGNVFGTGTNACEIASKNAIAIKISEDGDIKVYKFENNILNI
ncbi:hypothetical protein [Bacillus tropicus]|uniref:hypothetical protein n=1 Tax=Bacillus tropicus TaxID=2026188 RepID=UPI00119F9ABF|nr:hypothetical protein [Bacillus tropicus]